MALIVADSAEVRQRFTRDYEKAMRDLEEVRARLRQFEDRDKPQFVRWIHRELGTTLTELREVGLKLRTQEELLFRIQNMSLFEGVSPKKAYDYVMHEHEEAQRVQRETEEERSKGKAHDHTRQEEEAYRSGDEGEPFGRSSPRDDDDFIPSNSRKPGKADQEKQARLKEIYRLVVRKLHPDTQKEMTQHKLELWHQAQSAYGREDADQLEVILALCEIEDQSSTRHTRLSVLQRITAAFKRSLKPLRAELKKSQKDPAWNFSERSDSEMKQLSQRIQLEMERERMMLREELAEIEAELAQIKSSRKRRSRVGVDPFDIFFKDF
jgi:hypothetical protein